MGLAAVMEAALTLVLWLSTLRGVRSCGGRHGLGSPLGLFGLSVFSLCFKVLLRPGTNDAKMIRNIRVFAMYQIMLGWKRYTWQNIMKPTNSPTRGQPGIHFYIGNSVL